MQALINPIINIAYNAGEIILGFYYSENTLEIMNKGDNSPLTQADLKADDYIQEQLKKLTPNIPILSEEGELPDFNIRGKWKQYWLIDPLDGTKGFIKKNNQFTVNIALIENNEPILGVVYSPATQQCYYAAKNYGAFRINENHSENKIQCAILRQDEPLNILLSGKYPSKKMLDILSNLGKYDLSFSSSSIKFCKIAEGSAHLYPRLKPTSEWDTAAAHIILKEAGGEIISSCNQLPMLYNTSENILNSSFIAYSDDLCQVALKMLSQIKF